MKNSDMLKKILAAPLLALALTAGLLPEAQAQSGSQDKPYALVEKMPSFEGGEAGMLKFLGSNIQYPADAKAKGVEGLVVVQFIVEKDGSIEEVKTVKTLGHGTDEEAIRVILLSNGKWTPGSQKGVSVRVSYTLPIRFALSASDRAATADVANRSPQFKGGTEAMRQTMLPYLALPAEARQENVNARVMVKFYVDQQGNVSNIRLHETKLKKTVGPGSELDYMDASTFQLKNKAMLAKLSESAMAAVKATSGKWSPALKNGQPASVEVVLPVQFQGAESAAQAKSMPAPAMTKYTKASYKFEEADEKPVLRDGPLEKFLARNLRYPASVTFEGTYRTGIMIKPDGTVSGPWFSGIQEMDAKERSALHEEIMRVFKLMDGKWIPGKVDGQPVTVTKDIKILFVTDGGSKKASAEDVKSADVVVTRYK